MSDVTLRDATEGDAAAIQRVARKSWHEAYDEIVGVGTVQSTVDSWFDPDRLVRDDILPDDRPLFVATISDDVVGFIEGVPDDGDEERYHVYRIYVHPDHYGREIGTRLLERTALDRGARSLELTVFATNERARGFYESFGFEQYDAAFDDRFEVERIRYERTID